MNLTDIQQKITQIRQAIEHSNQKAEVCDLEIELSFYLDLEAEAKDEAGISEGLDEYYLEAKENE